MQLKKILSQVSISSNGMDLVGTTQAEADMLNCSNIERTDETGPRTGIQRGSAKKLKHLTSGVNKKPKEYNGEAWTRARLCKSTMSSKTSISKVAKL